MKTFKQFLFEATTGTSIGFFPGAFKPPHKGHFDTAKQAATDNDIAVVLISGSDRDGITTADSYEIWNMYKGYLPENVYIHTITGSPVTAIYQIVDILNNGQFSPTPKVANPLPDADKIAKMLQGSPAPYTINLYASQEDLVRFNAFTGPNKQIYVGKNVSKISRGNISRLASATQAREALKNKEEAKFFTFLPDIAIQGKQEIYRKLVK